MRHFLVCSILLALTPVAQAEPPELCKQYTDIIAAGMDARLAGIPYQDLALRHPAWAEPIEHIYRLPHEQLRGAERADFLTRAYLFCLRHDISEIVPPK